MDKNTIIGFVLIAAVLIGFGYWSKPSKAEREQAQAAAEASSQAATEAEDVKDKTTQPLTSPQDTAEAIRNAGIFASHAEGQEGTVELTNGKLTVTLSTKGGMVSEARVLGYKDQEGEDVTLLSPEDGAMTLCLPTKTENIDLSQLYFETEGVTDSTATMRLDAENGGKLWIDYRLRGGSYVVDMTLRSNGLEGYLPPNLRALDINWTDRARQQEKGFTFENRYSTLTYHDIDGKTKKLSETKDAEKEPEKELMWVAFKSQFFAAVLIGHQGLQEANLTSKQMKKGSGYLKEYAARMETPFDPSGKEPTVMQMYLGPNDFHVLKRSNRLSASDMNPELDELVYFGWPLVKWINRYFIIYLFDWLSALGLGMGMVLFLLTLIVKALVLPATRKSYLSSARMRVLKPEVDKLNAKYPKKEDAMKKQQEMMQLYNQYGVSPMGGCLPMLIQMPVWIALFNFVPNAIELRGQSFLWVKDLSTYDVLFSWHKEIWLLGDHISVFSLLFALTNVVNTWISMKQQQSAAMSAEQEQQMKMMKWMMYVMPVFFFFIFNDYSAGLCYYYFLSGLISILIMWGLRRFTSDEKLLAGMRAYKARHQGSAKSSKGLAARLEAMQKMAEEQQRQRQQKK